MRAPSTNLRVSNQTFDLEEHIKHVIRSVERKKRKESGVSQSKTNALSVADAEGGGSKSARNRTTGHKEGPSLGSGVSPTKSPKQATAI